MMQKQLDDRFRKNEDGQNKMKSQKVKLRKKSSTDDEESSKALKDMVEEGSDNVAMSPLNTPKLEQLTENTLSLFYKGCMKNLTSCIPSHFPNFDQSYPLAIPYETIAG